MLLKLDKRMLLVLAVLMMLVVIPISFAQDVSDADVIGVNDDSEVDAVSESASDDVNISTSDASSDVLGLDDYEIEITPNTASVSDYTPGESKSVAFSRNLGSGVDEDDDGSIWVNGSYTGDTSDGKKATPYKTIAAGINAASSGGTVKIA
jgi:hypothetical protein